MKPIIVYTVNVGAKSPQKVKEQLGEFKTLVEDASLTQIFLPVKEGESKVTCIHPGSIHVELDIKGMKDILEANLGSIVKGFFHKK